MQERWHGASRCLPRGAVTDTHVGSPQPLGFWKQQRRAAWVDQGSRNPSSRQQRRLPPPQHSSSRMGSKQQQAQHLMAYRAPPPRSICHPASWCIEV
jgi:hypothetical protein